MRGVYRHGHEVYAKNTSGSTIKCVIEGVNGEIVGVTNLMPNEMGSVYYKDAVIGVENIVVRIEGERGSMVRPIVSDSRSDLSHGELWHKYRISY